jgi:hypothetical protein
MQDAILWHILRDLVEGLELSHQSTICDTQNLMMLCCRCIQAALPGKVNLVVRSSEKQHTLIDATSH